jgi:hypothetical protein
MSFLNMFITAAQSLSPTAQPKTSAAEGSQRSEMMLQDSARK